jgi:hypothetical protein
MRTPAQVYVKSQRHFEPDHFELAYPPEYLYRRVDNGGSIKISNRRITISTALCGWDVGLKVTGSNHYAVWFGQLYLGEIDLETESFQVVR